MIKFPSNVLTFAAGNDESIALYESFVDYWRHYRSTQGAKNMVFATGMSLDEKESKLNAAIRKEIMRLAGIADLSKMPVEQWANHPVAQWATFAVVSAMIDMILPETMIDNIGLYCEVKTGGFGDSFAWEIKPRDLFTVSKAGRSQRVAEIHKQFNGLVTVIPEPRALTVGVNFYRVLAGKESLATFVAKATQSMEYQMTKEAYDLFVSTMAAVSNTASTGLRVAGYTQDALVDLAQRVTAWNGGQKAVILGTQRALVSVLPDDANYRYTLEDSFVKLGYLQTAFGYDLMVLPQLADWTNPFASLISNSYLWVVSPSSQKLLKLCLEGSTLANTTAPYDSASMTQTSTIWKSWGLAVATSAVAGTITL